MHGKSESIKYNFEARLKKIALEKGMKISIHLYDYKDLVKPKELA
jgi:hypothetical protein